MELFTGKFIFIQQNTFPVRDTIVVETSTYKAIIFLNNQEGNHQIIPN